MTENRLLDIFMMARKLRVSELEHLEQNTAVEFRYAVMKIVEETFGDMISKEHKRVKEEIYSRIAEPVANLKIYVYENMKENNRQTDDLKWRIAMLEEKLKEGK